MIEKYERQSTILYFKPSTSSTQVDEAQTSAMRQAKMDEGYFGF